jgi:soluble lytic murein transglycosylase
MIATAVFALALTATDPRLELLDLVLAERLEEALEATEQQLSSSPTQAQALGLAYLRGHLLALLGRRRPASDAFAEAMGATSLLEMHSRLRIAEVQEELGHPEVAAGLVASVVDPRTPRGLLSDAVRLLVRTLESGGDCRLLRGVEARLLPRTENRMIRLVQGSCALRSGEETRAREIYLGLLQEGVHDEAEREAAERFDAALQATGGRPTPLVARLLGAAFHQHRDFDRALAYFDQGLPPADEPLSEPLAEAAYLRARSLFWQERFEEAAVAFADLAQRTGSTDRRARAHFQVGRCFELQGKWRQALESYRACYRTNSAGRWADDALFAMMRIKTLLRQEEEAEKLLAALSGQRAFRSTTARASLFLAASDLVRGRSDRARGFLDTAELADPQATVEIAYWRGRLAELSGDPPGAVGAYLRVLERDPYHPLATAARRRLAQPHLERAARARGNELARGRRLQELYAAWLLLGDTELGSRCLGLLKQHLARDTTTRPWLTLAPLPPTEWRMWTHLARGPGELLLGLGIVRHATGEVAAHFPPSDPALAVTGSHLLRTAGEVRQSILRAEILLRRKPTAMPEALLPLVYRQLLFPLAHGDLIVATTRRAGVDPLLLSAIIREESRFDPRALSNASARGLTQFVLPTARRLAPQVGLATVAAEDLYRPEVSIPLGAAYLAELSTEFGGAAEAAVAAYNAGPAQARLWQSYCMSGEREEFLTKVTFSETRSYLQRVLSSWTHYQELYPVPAVPEVSPSTPSITGGKSSG